MRGTVDKLKEEVQSKYFKFLLSILAMQVIVAMFILGMSALVTLSYATTLNNQETSVNNQELLLDCTDSRRSDSVCQKYANQRTSSAVETLRKLLRAYILCADLNNGERAIDHCVVERLASLERAEDAAR